MKPTKGFTLIELLIVIAILAVLATVVVLVINPAELVRSARDANRVTDLDNINKALLLVNVGNPTTSFGSANTIYISIPDSSATCANLTLPGLPSGWSYACATSANHRLTNGSGWIPVNFGLVSGGSPFSTLPIDPTNSDTDSLYYTYVTGGSWALSGKMESIRYAQNAGSADGGADGLRYEVGNDLAIAPFVGGVVLYWSFDEGTGSTANNLAGPAHDGTLQNMESGDWETGKIGSALHFGGVNEYVSAIDTTNSPLDVSKISVEVWVNPDNTGSHALFAKGNYAFKLGTSAKPSFSISGGWDEVANYSLPVGQWTHVVVTYDPTESTNGLKFYVNGSLVYEVTKTSTIPPSNSDVLVGKHSFSSPYMVGLIDNIRVYNRDLTASEVSVLYEATK
jgi:prepilin-type N-terminal cleavage/methylation domain-containing protein